MNRQELLKNAKPILFNTEMVKAILDGKKSCTRRVVKLKDIQDVLNSSVRIESPNISDNQCIRCLCTAPYDAGDILYVRETWGKLNNDNPDSNAVCYQYRAGYSSENVLPKWHPSIHMPKVAARIFLRVTDVSVERLQNITEQDIHKEGVKTKICKECLQYADCQPQRDVDVFCGGDEQLIETFADLWDSTIKKADIDRYGWEANPWVWVIEFERVKIDEDNDRH
ncbi:MAG: hypothetical protein RR444_05045 [Oscillospiraceae bacterium]